MAYIYIYLYILETKQWTAGGLAWQSPAATRLADDVYHKIEIIYREYTLTVHKGQDLNSSTEKCKTCTSYTVPSEISSRSRYTDLRRTQYCCQLWLDDAFVTRGKFGH